MLAVGAVVLAPAPKSENKKPHAAKTRAADAATWCTAPAGMRGYEYRRLDGSTNRVQRTVDIATFNAPHSRVFIYLLSTRAGGPVLVPGLEYL